MAEPNASDEALEERRDWLFVLALLSAVLLAVVYVVAVRTGWGQRLDNAALDGRTTRLVVLHATSLLLDTISVTSLTLLGGAALAIAVGRRRIHLAVTAAAVVLGANLTSQFLKNYLLGRPDLTGTNDPLPIPSFPSGHTTVAMSLAVAFVLVVPARLRPTAAIFGAAYACLVGTGTVTAGGHRPSDVIGGFLVVAMWTGMAVAGLMRWRGAITERDPDAGAEPAVTPAFARIGALLLALGFGGFVVVYLAIRQDRLDAVRLDGAYLAALIVIVGAGLLVMAVLLAALRGVGLDPSPGEVISSRRRRRSVVRSRR
ncbi:MAG: phosphatase PAP2 family protein [Acidimicrobiia bacterium]